MRVYIIVMVRDITICFLESVWDTYELAIAEQRRLERIAPGEEYVVIARDINQRFSRKTHKEEKL